MENVSTKGKEPIVETATEANDAAADPSTEITLYVDDLDGSVTEEQLEELFGHMGDVESVIICVDEATEGSFRYGYVNYTNPEYAAKAMKVLNFSFLNGKQIRISYSNREGSMSGISCFGTLFFKNLDKGLNKKEVKDIFSVYGKVISCAVELDSTGISKGQGYVQFDSEEDARNATQHLNGVELKGEKLYVGPFCSKQEKLKFTNVHVSNLSRRTTENDLLLAFGKFGSINNVKVVRIEGVSKFFGFVNFENWEDAARSVEALHGTIIDGKKWHVKKASNQYEEGHYIRGPKAMARLYVQGIDYMIEDDELKESFSRFGTVTTCKIIRNRQGMSKGYGFVIFSTIKDAIEAISKMNGELIGCRRVNIKLGDGRKKRNRRLQSQGSTMHQTTRAPPPMVTTSMPPSSSTPAGVGHQNFDEPVSPIALSPMSQGSTMHQTTRAPPPMVATYSPPSYGASAGVGHQNFYEPVSPIALSPMPVYHAVQQQAVPGVRPSSGPLRRTLYTHPMTQWAPYTPPSYGAPAGVGRQYFYVPVSPVQFPPMPVYGLQPQPVPAVWASGTMYPPGLYAPPPMFPWGPQLQQFPRVYPSQQPAPWMDQQNLGDHL